MVAALVSHHSSSPFLHLASFTPSKIPGIWTERKKCQGMVQAMLAFVIWNSVEVEGCKPIGKFHSASIISSVEGKCKPSRSGVENSVEGGVQ